MAFMSTQKIPVASNKPAKKVYSAEFIRDYPILPYALRYVLGAYALIVVGATIAMLVGAAGMYIGGPGTSGGDIAFGIGAFVGFIGGLIPGFYALTTIIPKEPSVIQEGRIGALGAGCFFSLIVMLGVGIAITQAIDPAPFFLPLPVHVFLIALTGGLPAALCALIFMITQDAKLKAGILAQPNYRQPDPTDQICPKCNARNVAAQSFCHGCGHELRVPVQQQAEKHDGGDK
jgi:hypothetical protein